MHIHKIEINWLSVLLGINLALFIAMFFISQNIRYETDLVLIGALSTDYVLKGFPWLLITANFLHFDLFHFLFNMFSFFNLGRILNEFYSKKILLIVYIFAGISGSVMTVIAAQIFNNPMISIGASGSVFGLAGLLVGGTFKRQRYGLGLPFSSRDLILPIGVAFLIGFVPNLGVNNWAHLGGFIAGFILGLVIKNEMGELKDKNYIILEKIFFYSSILILILSFFLLLFNIAKVIFI